MKKSFFVLSSSVLLLLGGCNKKREFPDYKYSTVYFAYQAPVRTLVLGEDIYDNTLDNQHKFKIIASIGGVYENKKDVTLDLSIDNTLALGAKFNSATGADLVALPDNYYVSPPSKNMKIVIPSGSLTGGVEIQLTDAFFADPRSIRNTFVLPVKINAVSGADSVLRGSSTKTSPDRRKAADWATVPKDYVLYAVKYINPYHGTYLRRGVDQVKGNGGNNALDTTLIYRKTFVEQDELRTMYTKSLTLDTMALTTREKGNATNVPFQLAMTFAPSGDITVAAPASASYTVTGTGKFVKKGDMWGNEKRDVVYLKYQVGFANTTHNFTDTLVLRDRGVAFETFTPFVN
ncbi:MAG: DUF5627 domain-containing protein [Bacteroidota bacterium]